MKLSKFKNVFVLLRKPSEECWLLLICYAFYLLQFYILFSPFLGAADAVAAKAESQLCSEPRLVVFKSAPKIYCLELHMFASNLSTHC